MDVERDEELLVTPATVADRTLQSRRMRRIVIALCVALGVTTVPFAPGGSSPVSAALNAVVVDGTGFGHGRGMSQWGAYGWAVDHDKSWQWILDHYYGGTSLADVATAQSRIRVRLLGLDNLTTVGVTAGSGSVTAAGVSGRSMYAQETSPNRFALYSTTSMACPTSTALVVPDGPIARGSTNSTAVRQIQTFLNAFRIAGDITLTVDGAFGPLTETRLRAWQGQQDLAADGIWKLADATRARQQISSASGSNTWTFRGTVTGPVTFTSPNGENSAAAPASVLGVCDNGGRVTHYRGTLEFRRESFGTRVVNDVETEDYLRGVVPREISASWADAGGGKGVNAVRAQAVAARSYGLQQNRYGYASICDSQSCQVYFGSASRTSASSTAVNVEDPRTDVAIVATAGKIRRWPSGAIVSTEFSASNGPRTAGYPFPAVDDAGDATSRNPNHRWTRVLDGPTLAARYGLGTLLSVTMVEGDPRYDGIWYNNVVLTGTSRTRQIDAWTFRRDNGLPSPGFTIGNPGGSASSDTRLGPPRRIEVQVAGRDVVGTDGVVTKIPAGVVAASLNVTAVKPDDSGFITVWPCAAPRPTTSNLNYSRGAIDANGVIAPVDADGKACLYSNVRTDVVVDIAGWFGPPDTAGSGFTAITPERLMDTRPGSGFATGRVRPESPIQLQVRGANVLTIAGSPTTVPADAVAAAINVTSVNPTGPGYLTVWPCGVTRPVVSTLNFAAGTIRANGAIAPLGVDGKLCLYSHSPADVVVDIVGWFTAGGTPASSAFVSPIPQRWVDTRIGLGAPARPVAPSGPIEIPVAGRQMQVGGQPVVIPADAAAVSMNVTVVDAPGAGFATVWPCGTARPTTSNLNYPARRIVANNVVATVGATGSVCLYTHSSANVVVDVTGWFTRGGVYRAVVPDRAVDTRFAIGPGPV